MSLVFAGSCSSSNCWVYYFPPFCYFAVFAADDEDNSVFQVANQQSTHEKDTRKRGSSTHTQDLDHGFFLLLVAAVTLVDAICVFDCDDVDATNGNTPSCVMGTNGGKRMSGKRRG